MGDSKMQRPDQCSNLLLCILNIIQKKINWKVLIFCQHLMKRKRNDEVEEEHMEK